MYTRCHTTRTHRVLTCASASAFVAFLAAIPGCGPKATTATAGEPYSERAAASDAPTIVAYSFDPANHRANDVRTEAEQVIGQIPPPKEDAEGTETDTAAAITDTTWITIRGYRVQVFTSTAREQAERQAFLARQRFPQDSVYIVFQGGWNRVRIGDCRTRQEAVEKVDEAKNKGYRDPFWIWTDVRVMRRQGDPEPEQRE